MTFAAEEALRAAGVASLYLLIFALAETWKRIGAPPAEWTRKGVHIAGGLVALALPWLVRSHWTVLLLGGGFAAVVWGTRRMGWLGSVHGVERRSEGGIWYPIAVYLVFLLSADAPVFYLVAVLTLVLSDALAALVGTSYGRTSYQVEEDRRSVEGSAVFFFTTFLGVHLPLLLLTGIDPAASVLIAVQIALLVTFLEAVSVRGGDNLVVPLATYFLLIKMTPLPADQVAVHIGAQLAIVGLLAALMWRSGLLSPAGTVAASLFFYGVWSLGGPAWVAAPAAGLAVFALLFERIAPKETRARGEGRYQVLAVFHTSIVAVAAFTLDDAVEVLAGAPILPRGAFYPIYLGALAAHLAMVTTIFLHRSPWIARVRPGRLAAGMGVGALAVIPVGMLAVRLVPWGLAAAQAVAVALLAPLVYFALCRLFPVPERAPWDVRLQSAATAVAAVLVVTASIPLIPWP